MRKRPWGLWPRSFVLLFVALGVLIAITGRSGLFPAMRSADSGGTVQLAAAGIPDPSPPGGVALTPSAPAAAQPTATALPTATPSPTATPIPAPLKLRDIAAPEVGAVSAAVIDERSGALLYSKNAHLERAPASITKIATAIVALERGRLEDMVTVRYDPAELIDSTVMGVEPGDRLTLEDLLYGLMLPSGNDAALAIANHISGSSEAFAALMNAKVAELGLRNSHFVNPHGLDAKGHYTTAYDIAMLSRYGMGDATFRKLAAARLHPVTVYTSDGAVERYDVFNLNPILGTYRGADGVKIGFTDDARRTIVASATRDGHRVYVALLGSENLRADTPPLLSYVFDNFAWSSGQENGPR